MDDQPFIVRDYLIPAISAAVRAAGQPSPRVVCSRPVCVTDPAAARASAAGRAAVYGQLPSYRAMPDREGAAGPGDVAFVEDEDAAQILALAEAGATDFVAAKFARGQDRKDPQPAEGSHRQKLAHRAVSPH